MTNKQQIQTGRLSCNDNARPRTTVDFVFTIVTVLLSVTFPEVGDTLSGARSTTELIHTTCSHVCMDKKHETTSESLFIHVMVL